MKVGDRVILTGPHDVFITRMGWGKYISTIVGYASDEDKNVRRYVVRTDFLYPYIDHVDITRIEVKSSESWEIRTDLVAPNLEYNREMRIREILE